MEKIQCVVDGSELKNGRCLYTVNQVSNPEKFCSECLRFQKLRELGFDPIKGWPIKEIMGFVNYPPDGIIPIEELNKKRLLTTGDEIDTETYFLLNVANDRWRTDRDPLAAAEAFIISHDVGLYPPIWAIDWFVSGLKEYDRTHGEGNLDRILGFRSKRGQSKSFKRATERKRDGELMIRICALHRLKGLSVLKASEMVIQRFKKNPEWNKSGFKLTLPKKTTLSKMYSSNKSEFERADDDFLKKYLKEFEPKRSKKRFT